MASSTIGSAAKTGMDMATREWHFLRRVPQTAEELRLALPILDRILQQKQEQPEILDTVQSLRKKILETLDHYKTEVSGRWWTPKKHTIGNDLEEVKNLCAQLSSLKGLLPKEISSDSQAPTSGTKEEDECIIGFADVIEDLLHQLTPADSETHRRVITIDGMGGSGKTALARYIYNDAVAQRFACRAWVHVGHPQRNEDLANAIIDDFKICRGLNDDYKVNAKECIKKLLRDGNEDVSYLVVLDGMWNTQAWDYLKRILPTEKGNRVVITTRKRDVVENISDRLGDTSMEIADRIYQKELRFLNKKESWKLFCTITGHPEEQRNNPKEAMVDRCGGLPLAIKVLAKHLRRRKEHIPDLERATDFWAELLTYKHSLETDITQLLSLSYNDLCYNFKPCLMYVGMFPEDEEVDVDKLIRMLTAETFIHHPKTDVVARRSIMNLIENNLIQVARTLWEQPAKLKVQSLLRELIVQEASKVRPNDVLSFYIHAHHYLEEAHSLHIDKHVLRGNEIQQYLSDKNPNLMLETLMIDVMPQDSVLNDVVFLSMKIKTLVLLDMMGIYFGSKKNFKKLCEMIKCLKKLKYLGLAKSSIVKIPNTIGCLTSLQTLELDEDHNCEMIKEVKKLENLRQLHGRFLGNLSHIHKMFNLQTLKVVSVDEMSKIQTNLSNLQELHLSRSSKSLNEPFSFDITNLRNLHTLVLPALLSFPSLTPIFFPKNSNRILKFSLAGPIAGKNGELGELPNYITMLVLSESNLTKDPMDVLGKLPKLQSLDLINAYNGKELNCKVDGFRALNVLRLYGMKNLERLIVENGDMPALSKFHNGCTNSQLIVPPWLVQLPDML